MGTTTRRRQGGVDSKIKPGHRVCDKMPECLAVSIVAGVVVVNSINIMIILIVIFVQYRYVRVSRRLLPCPKVFLAAARQVLRSQR